MWCDLNPFKDIYVKLWCDEKLPTDNQRELIGYAALRAIALCPNLQPGWDRVSAARRVDGSDSRIRTYSQLDPRYRDQALRFVAAAPVGGDWMLLSEEVLAGQDSRSLAYAVTHEMLHLDGLRHNTGAQTTVFNREFKRCYDGS